MEQVRIDNPERLATLGTEDKQSRQTQQSTENLNDDQLEPH